MPEFKYKAADINGKSHSGKASAADKDALREILKTKEKLYLLSCEEIKRDSLKTKFKSSELALFCRELGSLLKAGVPLAKSLSIISSRSANKRLCSVLRDVLKELRQGSPLSSALRSVDAFPEILVSAVFAGETSGRLFESCLNMSEYYEREKKLSAQIRAAMLYPLVLLGITAVVIVVVFAVIMPSFMRLFDDMKLPLVTRVMIFISDLFTKYPLPLLLIVAAVIALVWSLGRIGSVRLFLDKVKLSLPVVGRLNKIVCTARFAKALSALYASGTGILSAVTISFDSVSNSYIKSQTEKCLRSIRAGNTLSSSLLLIDGFDEKLAATTAVGEESSDLMELLFNISEDYDQEAAEAAKRLITLIEPLMIILMSLIVLTVICSVLLPVYQLYSSIDGSYSL